MKKNEKINIITTSLIILCGIFILVLPWYKNVDNSIIVGSMMLIIGTVKLSNHILRNDKKDLEDLFIAIVCFLAYIYCLYLGNNKDLIMYPLVITIWIFLCSMVRLKKLDYLHDHKDARFEVYLYTSILFLIIGIISGLSLYYNDVTSTFIVGYLNILYGILCLSEEYTERNIKGKL